MGQRHGFVELYSGGVEVVAEQVHPSDMETA
jgi:hypothetical protein